MRQSRSISCIAQYGNEMRCAALSRIALCVTCTFISIFSFYVPRETFNQYLIFRGQPRRGRT
nr:MAG TPA: hypothetical protein [Inoviridae sp.]